MQTTSPVPISIFSRPDSPGDSSIVCSSSTSEDDSTTTQLELANRFVLTPDSSISEIKEAINLCKDMINESDECSNERKWLVRHLVELRLRIQQIEDAEDNPTEMGFCIAGHHFEIQKPSTSKQYCDHCTGIIWNVVQGCYICKDCKYKCHPKCVKNVGRVCAHVVATENGELIMSICPIKGLAAQLYKCAECKVKLEVVSRQPGINFRRQLISVSDSEFVEPRLCDYTGLYFCSTCHWNNTCEIPARVIHNWDWEKRYVSQAAYQLLNVTKNVPLINIETVNEKLFNFVSELELIRKLRNDLKIMIRYLVGCKKGNNLVTSEIINITETPKLFSMGSLEDIKNDSFKYLYKITETCQQHISNCDTCSGKGYICEICGNNEVIYPFDPRSVGCKICNSYFHHSCYMRKNSKCPKCIRLQERKNRLETEDEQDYDR